jgi:hypothetical protein
MQSSNSTPISSLKELLRNKDGNVYLHDEVRSIASVMRLSTIAKWTKLAPISFPPPINVSVHVVAAMQKRNLCVRLGSDGAFWATPTWDAKLSLPSRIALLEKLEWCAVPPVPRASQPG